MMHSPTITGSIFEESGPGLKNHAATRTGSPRVARIEAYIECIVALKDCATFDRRSGIALGYIERTRSKLEHECSTERLSYPTFSGELHRLDAAEARLAFAMLKHSSKLQSQIIPPMQDAYRHLECVS
jgi:hypothetical protein